MRRCDWVHDEFAWNLSLLFEVELSCRTSRLALCFVLLRQDLSRTTSRLATCCRGKGALAVEFFSGNRNLVRVWEPHCRLNSRGVLAMSDSLRRRRVIVPGNTVLGVYVIRLQIV